MPRSGKSKIGTKREFVAPVAGQRPLVGAHSGSADLMCVLEKVLPFLFKKKKSTVNSKQSVVSGQKKKAASNRLLSTANRKIVKKVSASKHVKTRWFAGMGGIPRARSERVQPVGGFQPGDTGWDGIYV